MIRVYLYSSLYRIHRVLHDVPSGDRHEPDDESDDYGDRDNGHHRNRILHVYGEENKHDQKNGAFLLFNLKITIAI